MRETLRAVRAAVEPGFPVGIRLSDQLAQGGITAEECALIADYSNPRVSSTFSTVTGQLPRAAVNVARDGTALGSMLPSSATIVSGVKHIPRILTAARVRTLEEAEQMLRDGLGDLIGLQRANIADPDLVRKTREGRVDEVRPCVACNQGCVGGLLSAAMRLGCAVNPAVGFELTLSEDLIVRTPRPKRVLVVGGGPGGLEAARVAALAGHRVSLFEASSSLGGTVNVAKLAPKMHTFGDITNWLEREVERLGVEVRTNTYVEAADVLTEKPDVVIVATGARPRMDGVQVAIPAQPAIGVEQSHVLSSTDLLTDRSRTLGGHALVFDDVGGYEAVAAADFLIEKGVAVTFATRCSSFAPIVDTWTRAEPALERLHAGRFRLVTRAHLVEVRPHECVIRPLQGSEHEVVPADHVVLVLPRESLADLHTELRGAVPHLAIVGDALSPRDLQARCGRVTRRRGRSSDRERLRRRRGSAVVARVWWRGSRSRVRSVGPDSGSGRKGGRAAAR
jgi:thioredoxin reductase